MAKSDQNKPATVPDQDATYLHANHKSQSVPQMAKHLKRASATVYNFMDALGLEPKGRVIDKTHPFVRANRKLRAVLIDERQARSAQKSKQ